MYTENGPLVDISEITDIVRHADVFAVSFRLFPERLLIDTRYDDEDATGACTMPMVAIVDPVATMQERFFWLGQHRPALGMPKNFMFFHWPHSVRYLEESGIWDRVRARVTSTHFAGARETCSDALRDLVVRERAAAIDAINGTRYQTLWSTRDS
jgi:hypothetical protein